MLWVPVEAHPQEAEVSSAVVPTSPCSPCSARAPAALAAQHVANVLRDIMFAWELCCLRSRGMHMDLLPHSISASVLNFHFVAEE